MLDNHTIIMIEFYNRCEGSTGSDADDIFDT